jgi:DNA-binding beta-propeller fold protein YncE
MSKFLPVLAAFLAVMSFAPCLRAQTFTHAEARHTHSLALTPDGSRLLAVHSAEARLSVFAVGDAGNVEPVLVAEIPVGLEPVAVRARTNDEVWVVNELSDSVSIVSLSAGAVVATLKASDEPADVVFAAGRAFVSCARSNSVRVFDVVTRAEIATLPVQGLVPSALATNAAGTLVYAAFLHSGNGTTILPKNLAPAPPAPTNPNLPPAPQTGLIVAANDPRIAYTVLDRDVVEIDAATAQVVRYFSGAGTNLLDVVVHPLTADVWVANTEARNLVRFEPALRGHIADHRITRLAQSNGAATIFDLNPGIDYATLPNPAAQSTALAQPTALVFSGDGATAWIAAFGSDRIAKVDPATGAVLARTELRSSGQTSRQMRGPRALALHPTQPRLYVLNKLSSTISVLGTAAGTLLAEVPVGSYDPMPADIREGRGFLFDARLSGNGLSSCATCHLDADRDGLAWDLGDPGGEMQTVIGANLVIHDPTPRPREMHPMKGPMVTQTLRGMTGGAPFHWRGDRATLQDFNPTFDKLMGGAQLPAEDIDALAAYLVTLRNHPNPNLLRNGNPPVTLAGGDPTRGADLFTRHNNHCNLCHNIPRGSNNNIDLPQEVGSPQPLKNPSLRTVYQRLFLSPASGGQTRSGFGLNHDGSGHALPTVHPYVLDELGSESLNDFADVTAFVLCFPTETRPAVGDGFTVTTANTAAIGTDLAQMESLARASACDFVARGTVAGVVRTYFYNRLSLRYEPDAAGEPVLTTAQLLALLGAGDALTFLGTPLSEGRRFATDRNGDGTRNRDETLPALLISRVATSARVQWPAAPADWTLESATTLHGPWTPVTGPRSNVAGLLQRDEPLSGARFYRLRRTW